MSRKIRKPPQDKAEQKEKKRNQGEGAVKEESFMHLGKTPHRGEIRLDRGRISAPKEGRP